MIKCPERTLAIVNQLGQLPSDLRPDALIFEDPVGEYFPDEIAGWTRLLRKAMDDNGWTSKFQEDGKPDGMLLFHSHKQWGLADASVLDFLAAGGDGIWSSISEEGAMGHACSAVTLANLARLGNKDKVTRYETRKHRQGGAKSNGGGNEQARPPTPNCLRLKGGRGCFRFCQDCGRRARPH